MLIFKSLVTAKRADGGRLLIKRGFSLDKASAVLPLVVKLWKQAFPKSSIKIKVFWHYSKNQVGQHIDFCVSLTLKLQYKKEMSKFETCVILQNLCSTISWLFVIPHSRFWAPTCFMSVDNIHGLPPKIAI